MMDDDEGCLMMVLVKVMAMAMVMVTPADDGDGDGDGDGDDGDGHGDGDDSGHCRLKHFLGHGLRKLWAVVVPIQLDSRAARRPGPWAATQLRGSRGPLDVLVHSLQTRLPAQRSTACFVLRLGA